MRHGGLPRTPLGCRLDWRASMRNSVKEEGYSQRVFSHMNSLRWTYPLLLWSIQKCLVPEINLKQAPPHPAPQPAPAKKPHKRAND